ncbi:protein-glucosylgalactosylhydroxylysine glucosidase [Culex quinquefasciatus]|uniref:protein-glucosylgalactosylhydroxylysine glucosidase n=1 Tax=Culex quinquefasciatus TaxID=7176 RepID=UPI0018E31877|nr:protein-glucosylgalactosylhydroxylysine glucosidase [Culex quinquefasciatus]
MRTITLLTLLFAGSILLIAGQDSSFKFNSERFPTSIEEIPALSNGNLGFAVHSDDVFLTGVYSGLGERSHRARLPNYGNLHIDLCDPRAAVQPQCTYQLDIEFGRFRTVYQEPNAQFRIVHDVYPHRYFDHTMVNNFRLERLNGQGALSANVRRIAPVPSTDITLGEARPIVIRNRPFLGQCGTTNEVEDLTLQNTLSEVCIFYEEYPTVLELGAGETVPDVESLGITVEGNAELDRALRASAFQIFSNYPSSVTSQAFAYEMFGISSSGLGRDARQGHNFWDFELWTFPMILLVDPFLARDMLRYRIQTTRAGAARNAELNGFDGWQYPWASAFTGIEVASAAESDLRYHVTADVAFAGRLYMTAMDDLAWFQTHGCTLAYETAKFWMNRTVYNQATDRYDISSVTGPDDSHQNVTNNVYTNVMAAHNLFFGEFAGCYCRFDLNLQDGDWQELASTARSIRLPYDPTTNTHPQFEEYTAGTPISQADAILLGYPLQLPMTESTKRNNMEAYAKVTAANAPAPTWSMHTIGWLDVDNLERAATDFSKNYQQFMRAPFYIWNERIEPTVGTPNYVPGAGAFLQAVVNGYAGVRLHTEEMTLRPRLPPGTTRLHIPQIGYMRANFALDIRPNGFTLTFQPAVMNPQIRIFVDDEEHPVCSGCSFEGTHNATLVLARSSPVFNNCRLQPTVLNRNFRNGGTASSVAGSLVTFFGVVAAYVISKLI